ncbi:MAG: proton-conducting transporter membrane subunit, partial [Planctomycetota bacterium]|nr:proton-conducting transporter membrane subunit [Planctomycetota bacterium]
MNLQNLVENLITDTWGSSSSEGFGWDVFAASSLGQFLPELAVCTAIVAILVFRLFSIDRWIPSYWVALGGALIAFAFALTDFARFLTDPVRQEIFTGLLVYDEFTAFFRLFLLLFVILVIALTVLSGIPDNDDGPDFYTLLLGSVIGMMLMASANHLLILFLAIEMASVPSYVMVGFLKGRKDSSEAALKFVVYGAGAAGVMLYGTSLLA